MAELKRARIAMPSAGMNTVAAPGAAPDGKGPLVRNFLPHLPGKMVMRGPIDGKVFRQPVAEEIIGRHSAMVAGVWSHNQNMFIGFFSDSPGTGVPPWKAPYLKTQETAGLLASSSGAVALVNTATNTMTAVNMGGSGQELVPCLTGARIENFTYGYGAGNNTEIYANLNGGIEASRKLLKWSGEKSKTIAFTNAPRSGQFVKNYLSRLWVLGGRSPEEELNFTIVPSEAESVTKAASSILKFYGKNNENYFTVGQEIRALNASIPAGATISAVSYEVGTNQVKVTINKEVTTTAVGLVETKRPTFKPEPNTIFYSEAGGPTEDTLAKWKSPTTGLINRIIVGDEDKNDFGVALAVVSNTLIIFKRHSVWALYGTSPETFQIRNLTYEFGCVDPWSVCETHYGVYFMSQNGLQYFNGEGFDQVDSEIENITAPLVSEVAGEAADQGYQTYLGRVSVTDVGNGYLMMSIARQTLGALPWDRQPSWVGIMHMDSHNWSEFTTGNLEGQQVIEALDTGKYPILVGKTYQYPWFFDGKYIMDLNSITAVNEDVNVDSASGTKTAIPAMLKTDRIVLSTPGYVSQLHRLMQDYTWPNGANDAAAAAGWWWSYLDGDGTVVQEPVQLPGTGFTATNFLRGRRWEQDNFNEIVDGRIEIEWKSSTLEVRNPELYDATVEFSLSRQRRTI